MRQQAGFTLVEIAIVLVIIGLLLGGVLKGQEIITNAKIKNLESDFNGISAAIYSYQDRYRAIPGDDKNTVARWTVAVPPGDGNSKIAAGNTIHKFDSTTAGEESRLFWLHLRNAGLVRDLADREAKVRALVEAIPDTLSPQVPLILEFLDGIRP